MAYEIKDKDGHPIVTKDGSKVLGADSFEEVELKDFSDKERSFLAVANAESEDRFKDVIMAKGWILDNYRKNAVVMAFHNYGTLPVGRSLEEFTKKRKGVNTLFFRPQFAAYPDTMRMYEMYRDKYLKGFSVGFLPVKEEPIKGEEEDEEEKILLFHTPTRFLEQELLEVSCVPIPAHPDALSEIKGMVKRGKIYIPARYLEEQEEPEVEVYDEYLHVKFADVDKFVTLYAVETEKGVIRVFGRRREQEEGELFDHKFIFSKSEYTEEQVLDLAKMLTGEKYEGDHFASYNPDMYNTKEAVTVAGITCLGEECFLTLDGSEEEVEFEEDEYIEKDEVEIRPYPNEHACRLNDPGKYDKFARKNCYKKSDGKCIDYIFGIKGGKSETQAFRYPKDIWSASAAKAHCAKSDGTFEVASKAEKEKFKCECIDCGHKVTSEKHCDSYKCPECGGDMRRVERPGPGKGSQMVLVDNVYVYSIEEPLEEERVEEIRSQVKEVFGEEAKVLIIDSGAKFGKLGEVNFVVEMVEKVVDEIVERVIKAVKGVLRKEEIEIEIEEPEDEAVIELEEESEEEGIELENIDEDSLTDIVSDSIKGALGKLD